MAFDAFLKIDGVDGESQDSRHQGEIELLSFSWGESQAGNVAHGGGGGAGKVSMQDFHFTMRLSKASPKLMLSCASGQHIKSAVLTLRKAGGEQTVGVPSLRVEEAALPGGIEVISTDVPTVAADGFLKFTLSDILVSSYEVRAGAEPHLSDARNDAPAALADGAPVDAVSLNFGKLQVEARAQNVDGSLGGAVKAGWDLKTNTGG
jgi:type VI secretion system secreted protein Hcp